MTWLGFQAIAWALMIAWIAQTAQARGRNFLGWALGAAIVGAAGFLAGFQLLTDAAERDGSAHMVASALAPTGLMLGMMAGIGLVLRREPVVVSSRKDWPVHVMGRGDGSVRVAAGAVEITWKDGSISRPLAEVAKAEPDGECVRVTVGGEELALLPMGKPATREGRIAQSRAIALQLRPR